MHKGSPGSVQVLKVEANRFQSPARCAIATGETRPDILMRVNEYPQAMFPGLIYHCCQIIEICLVINPRTSMFYRFPGRQKPYCCQPPMAQPPKMLIRLRQGEWPPNETHLTVIKKPSHKCVAPFGSTGTLRRRRGLHPVKAFVGQLDQGTIDLRSAFYPPIVIKNR